jgi:hypothetical protein
MYLCFATPWRTSWKLLCYVFLYGWNTHLTFNALLLMIFCSCYFSCYNMIAKFYCQDYISYAHVLSTLISALNALHRWSRLWWCMSPQKLLFCYHLPTRGRAGVKLGGCLICLKRIYNFWCSMLVYTPFALCCVTLRGIFMHFPELTY